MKIRKNQLDHGGYRMDSPVGASSHGRNQFPDCPDDAKYCGRIVGVEVRGNRPNRRDDAELPPGLRLVDDVEHQGRIERVSPGRQRVHRGLPAAKELPSLCKVRGGAYRACREPLTIVGSSPPREVGEGGSQARVACARRERSTTVWSSPPREVGVGGLQACVAASAAVSRPRWDYCARCGLPSLVGRVCEAVGRASEAGPPLLSERRKT